MPSSFNSNLEGQLPVEFQADRDFQRIFGMTDQLISRPMHMEEQSKGAKKSDSTALSKKEKTDP